MKYNIDEKDAGLEIRIDDVKGKKEKLLQAFQECQEGRCSCPTEEYKKMDSLKIEHGDETIELKLTAKQGEKIDREKINKCLDYTAERIDK